MIDSDRCTFTYMTKFTITFINIILCLQFTPTINKVTMMNDLKWKFTLFLVASHRIDLKKNQVRIQKYVLSEVKIKLNLKVKNLK